MAIYHEAWTSTLQAYYFSKYAAKLTFRVGPGPSDSIVFPKYGPYDRRLGYVQLPNLIKRLRSHGMAIRRQSRFSPDLRAYANHGFYIPYEEKSQAGLDIADNNLKTLYHVVNPARVYRDFYDIPSVIIQALLFIENRDLLANTFHKPDGSLLMVGGKTGTGDNRIVTSSSSGYRISSRTLNRTATFVFYLGDNYFGTLTAFVNGSSANTFSFTSSLPIQVLKGQASILQPYISDGQTI